MQLHAVMDSARAATAAHAPGTLDETIAIIAGAGALERDSGAGTMPASRALAAATHRARRAPAYLAIAMLADPGENDSATVLAECTQSAAQAMDSNASDGMARHAAQDLARLIKHLERAAGRCSEAVSAWLCKPHAGGGLAEGLDHAIERITLTTPQPPGTAHGREQAALAALALGLTWIDASERHGADPALEGRWLGRAIRAIGHSAHPEAITARIDAHAKHWIIGRYAAGVLGKQAPAHTRILRAHRTERLAHALREHRPGAPSHAWDTAVTAWIALTARSGSSTGERDTERLRIASMIAEKRPAHLLARTLLEQERIAHAHTGDGAAWSRTIAWAQSIGRAHLDRHSGPAVARALEAGIARIGPDDASEHDERLRARLLQVAATIRIMPGPESALAARAHCTLLARCGGRAETITDHALRAVRAILDTAVGDAEKDRTLQALITATMRATPAPSRRTLVTCLVPRLRATNAGGALWTVLACAAAHAGSQAATIRAWASEGSPQAARIEIGIATARQRAHHRHPSATEIPTMNTPARPPRTRTGATLSGALALVLVLACTIPSGAGAQPPERMLWPLEMYLGLSAGMLYRPETGPLAPGIAANDELGFALGGFAGVRYERFGAEIGLIAPTDQEVRLGMRCPEGTDNTSTCSNTRQRALYGALTADIGPALLWQPYAKGGMAHWTGQLTGVKASGWHPLLGAGIRRRTQSNLSTRLDWTWIMAEERELANPQHIVSVGITWAF